MFFPRLYAAFAPSELLCRRGLTISGADEGGDTSFVLSCSARNLKNPPMVFKANVCVTPLPFDEEPVRLSQEPFCNCTRFLFLDAPPLTQDAECTLFSLLKHSCLRCSSPNCHSSPDLRCVCVGVSSLSSAAMRTLFFSVQYTWCSNRFVSMTVK